MATSSRSNNRSHEIATPHAPSHVVPAPTTTMQVAPVHTTPHPAITSVPRYAKPALIQVQSKPIVPVHTALKPGAGEKAHAFAHQLQKQYHPSTLHVEPDINAHNYAATGGHQSKQKAQSVLQALSPVDWGHSLIHGSVQVVHEAKNSVAHSFDDWISKSKQAAVTVGQSAQSYAVATATHAADFATSTIHKTETAATSAWNYARSLVHKAVGAGVEAKERVLSTVKGVSDTIGNWVVDQVSQVWGTEPRDGELTGPFVPKQIARHQQTCSITDSTLAEGAVAKGAVIFVNGIINSYQDHCKAAQRIADATATAYGRPLHVVGVYNATAIPQKEDGTIRGNLGGMFVGGVRDAIQYGEDRLTAGQFNRATQTLVRILDKYGSPGSKNHGMKIVAHSQGSVIVSDALWQLKQRKEDLSKFDVTTFGNATYLFPKGAKYHHYAFDNDPVSSILGSNSALMYEVYNNSTVKTLARYAGYGDSSDNQADTITLHRNVIGINAHNLNDETNPTDDYIAQWGKFEAKESLNLPKLNPFVADAVYFDSTAVSLGLGIENTILNAEVSGSRYLPAWAGKPLNFIAKSGLAGTSALQNSSDSLFNRFEMLQHSRMGGEKTSGLPRYEYEPSLLRSQLIRSGGAGSLLPSVMRRTMFPTLGFDPHHARIHYDTASAEAAETLNAEAFTIGRDIFFGAGKYRPNTPEGLGLLAHELTHVGQQSGHVGSPTRFFTPHGGDAMEQEAQRSATHVLARIDDRRGLLVEEYARHYETESHSGLTTEHATRLDRISLLAIQEADSLLKLQRDDGEMEMTHLELDEVEVSLDLDLEQCSDAEAASIWACAIVNEVEHHRNVNSGSVKNFLSHISPHTGASVALPHTGIVASETGSRETPYVATYLEEDAIQFSRYAPAHEAWENSLLSGREYTSASLLEWQGSRNSWEQLTAFRNSAIQRQAKSNAVVNIAKMNLAQKMWAVICKAAEELPGESGSQLKAMFTKEALETTAAILAAWGLSHLAGIGFIGDLGMAGFAAWTLGRDAWTVGKDLGNFAWKTYHMSTQSDLNEAAHSLAEAISISGIDALMTFLGMKAGKFVKGRLNKVPKSEPIVEKPLVEKPLVEKPLVEKPLKPGAPKSAPKTPRTVEHGVRKPTVETEPRPKSEAPKREIVKQHPKNQTTKVPNERQTRRPISSKDPRWVEEPWEREFTGKHPKQKISDLDQLYKEAEVAQQELAIKTEEIAGRVGGRAQIPETLKGKARTMEKIETSYKGDASKIADLARTSIVVDTLDQVPRALEEVRRTLKVVQVKHRFRNPLNGYRDILLNVEMENGHIAEIQIQLKSLWEVKELGKGHALYEQIRSIQAEAKKAGRKLTPEEMNKIGFMQREMKAAYDHAYHEAGGE